MQNLSFIKKNLIFLASFSTYILWVGLSVANAEKKSIGKIIAIIGQAEFINEAPEAISSVKGGSIKKVSSPVWQKVIPHQKVFPKDVFRTSKKSRLRILFDDSSLMALGPSTKMKVSSYFVDSDKKFRQGVMDLAHGLSMYIINKQHKSEGSSFKMVSPTANITARGTQGYLSVSKQKTLIANLAGAVSAENSDPVVPGEVLVGIKESSIVEEGKPPTEPKPIRNVELQFLQQTVMGWPNLKIDEESNGEPSIEEAFEEEFEPFDDIDTNSCKSG